MPLFCILEIVSTGTLVLFEGACIFNMSTFNSTCLDIKQGAKPRRRWHLRGVIFAFWAYQTYPYTVLRALGLTFSTAM